MSRSNNDVDAKVRDAVRRLEAAVEDLSAVAKDRAADSVEWAAERLQDAVARARQEDAGTDSRERRSRNRAAHYREPLREPTWLWSDKPRTRSLFRDDENGKIFGVCAGIANYYGMESWVVRCLAVTGLIFLNWMVLAAYLIAALIMDKTPKDARPRTVRRVRTRRKAGEASESPAPRRQLRDVRADLDEAELRLRRMETHVTSGRYELQRELAKIGGT